MALTKRRDSCRRCGYGEVFHSWGLASVLDEWHTFEPQPDEAGDESELRESQGESDDLGRRRRIAAGLSILFVVLLVGGFFVIDRKRVDPTVSVPTQLAPQPFGVAQPGRAPNQSQCRTVLTNRAAFLDEDVPPYEERNRLHTVAICEGSRTDEQSKLDPELASKIQTLRLLSTRIYQADETITRIESAGCESGGTIYIDLRAIATLAREDWLASLVELAGAHKSNDGRGAITLNEAYKSVRTQADSLYRVPPPPVLEDSATSGYAAPGQLCNTMELQGNLSEAFDARREAYERVLGVLGPHVDPFAMAVLEHFKAPHIKPEDL